MMVSFLFDSFIARTDRIFQFLVAWKRMRKVETRFWIEAYDLAPLFFAATIRLAYTYIFAHAVVIEGTHKAKTVSTQTLRRLSRGFRRCYKGVDKLSIESPISCHHRPFHRIIFHLCFYAPDLIYFRPRAAKTRTFSGKSSLFS